MAMSVDPLSAVEIPASVQYSIGLLKLHSEIKTVLYCYDTPIDPMCCSSRSTSFGIRHGFESY